LTIGNQQQNLINDLKAPIKSFRIFALEEAIKSGASREVLEVLEQLKIEEDDGECQVLINYAIAAVAERLAGKEEKPVKKIKEQQEFLDQWNGADESARMKLLSTLPSRLPAAIRTIGPDLLAQEKSSIVAARIVRTFCRYWPEEKFMLITSLLNSKSLSLRLASLRTIVHMKPELILEDLPGLLRSEDPQIKALAIRALAKIDKEEALKHLQALLLSASLSDRLAGIQNCPFLPFEMVKPVILKYFAVENHPELLIRAGWILEMNPDVQVPFKLYEIAERSPAKKAELVKQILNDAVKLLEKSGILGNQFGLYNKKLQAWVNKRRTLRFVKKVVARLNAETIPAELDELIRSNLNQPLVCEAFNEALTWPTSETVKSRISAYIKGAQQAQPVEQPVQSAAKQSEPEVADSSSSGKEKKPALKETKDQPPANKKLSLNSIPDSAKIKILAGLTPQQANELLSEISSLVADKNKSSELRVAALHGLTRLKMKGLEKIAEKLVNASDIPLATAALEYMGEIDPEAIFPYIGKCLKVPDVRMKSAALGILKNFDFNQAVSSLNAMLKSTDPGQQKMALECMDQFDFALIRDQLTEFLEKSDNETLVEAGLCQFAANPADENAYSLYKIEKAHSGNISSQARKLREKCNVSLQDSQIKVAEKTAESNSESVLNEKYQQEQKRKKQSRPAYAYRETSVEQAGSFSDNIQAVGVTFKEFASARSSYIVLAILIFLGVGFYVFFVPSSGPHTGTTQGNAIVSGQYLREGTVTRTSGTAIEFSSVNGEKFVFHPTRDGYRMPARNSKLRVSLVPYRRNPDGTFLARVRAMRIIDSFSTNSEGKK
jgi:HEAT repeat protein